VATEKAIYVYEGAKGEKSLCFCCAVKEALTGTGKISLKAGGWKEIVFCDQCRASIQDEITI
jgi:hypothetical protein